jgi:SAM-dependent methyltransferase
VAPSPWVARFADLAPPGEVLDVACGTGRHARYFLARGRKVTGLDRYNAGVVDLLGDPDFVLVEIDLEDGGPWPLAERRFAAVIVTNYLHRPLLPAIVAAVEPGGVLLYETFALGNERHGRPRNPDFLLAPGELLEAVRGALHVVAYEHGEVERPHPAVVQRLCAVNAPIGGYSQLPSPQEGGA